MSPTPPVSPATLSSHRRRTPPLTTLSSFNDATSTSSSFNRSKVHITSNPFSENIVSSCTTVLYIGILMFLFFLSALLHSGVSKGWVFKNITMPYPDLCAALYDGSSATGNNQWSSTVQITSGGTSSSAHHVQTLQTQDDPFDDLEDDEGTSVPNATDDIPPTNQEETSARGQPSKKPNLNLNEITLDMQKALQHLIKSEGSIIDECYEKLKLVGLSPIDPLFLAAFNIFGQSSQMRESWMGLPSDPEVLKAWIQLAGKQFGIFN